MQPTQNVAALAELPKGGIIECGRYDLSDEFECDLLL
jgi:hypothetical protein